LGKTDRDRYLRMAGNIKGLANTKKNYEGKMFGLKQTSLLALKTAEQEELHSKMVQAGDRNTGFFKVIDSLYTIRLAHAKRDLLLNRLNFDCGPLAAAITISALKKGKAPSKKDT